MFAKYDPDRCCLCGFRAPLTAEHKFKATQIKTTFPDSEILSINNPEWRRPKFVQGAKSNSLKFRKSICAKCNNERTQGSDRAFDAYQRRNMANLASVLKSWPKIGGGIKKAETKFELNVFRYFAKLLCCFLAEVEGPRPIEVGKFAAGISGRNPIFLNISEDPAPSQISSLGMETGWVAHGGLWVMLDQSKKRAEKIGSRLTIETVRYEYWIQPRFISQLQLLILFPEFMRKVRVGVVNDAP